MITEISFLKLLLIVQKRTFPPQSPQNGRIKSVLGGKRHPESEIDLIALNNSLIIVFGFRPRVYTGIRHLNPRNSKYTATENISWGVETEKEARIRNVYMFAINIQWTG